MKISRIQLITLIAAAVACLCLVRAQDESASGAAKRTGLLQRKGLASRSVIGKPSTTTTTEEAYYNEEQDGDEQHEGEEDRPLQPTTTTEAPKKIGPAIRPFRSNDDLLAALKKRRLHAKTQKTATTTHKPIGEQEQDDTETTNQASQPKGTKSSSHNAIAKRRFGVAKSSVKAPPPTEDQAQVIEEGPAPQSAARRLGRSRFAGNK